MNDWMREGLLYGCAIGIALCIFPVIVLFAGLVWVYDRHNPFYIAPRIGKGGRLFKMIKLRSMVANASAYHLDSTAADDPRITPIGRLIRRLKLDEFTQIINVLMGDIRLVGPRPQVPAEVQRYTDEEKKILSVKPGITDIASIVFADESELLKGASNPDLLYAQIERPWKSRLALLYVQHATLWLDLQLMALTVANFFARRWVLARLSQMVAHWGSDVDDLPAIVARTKQPYAYPVPGATEVIQSL